MKKLTHEEKERLLQVIGIKRSDEQIKWVFELMRMLRNDEVRRLVDEDNTITSDKMKGCIKTIDFALDYYDNFDEKKEQFEKSRRRR